MKQRIFRAHEARFPLAVLLAVLVGGIGLASQAKAADLSGNATLTTDYVWRGSTQTQGDPAAQAGIRIAGASGFYGPPGARTSSSRPPTMPMPNWISPAAGPARFPMTGAPTST